jgi:hypothetical protein
VHGNVITLERGVNELGGNAKLGPIQMGKTTFDPLQNLACSPNVSTHHKDAPTDYITYAAL